MNNQCVAFIKMDIQASESETTESEAEDTTENDFDKCLHRIHTDMDGKRHFPYLTKPVMFGYKISEKRLMGLIDGEILKVNDEIHCHILDHLRGIDIGLSEPWGSIHLKHYNTDLVASVGSRNGIVLGIPCLNTKAVDVGQDFEAGYEVPSLPKKLGDLFPDQNPLIVFDIDAIDLD